MNDRTQHFHFDEAKIIAKNEEVRASYTTRAEEAGAVGVEARLKCAVIPDFTLAMTREINRGTSPEDIEIGMASLLAHIALTYIISATGGTEGTPENRAMLAHVLMSDAHTMIAHGLGMGNEAITTTVSAEQGGRA